MVHIRTVQFVPRVQNPCTTMQGCPVSAGTKTYPLAHPFRSVRDGKTRLTRCAGGSDEAECAVTERRAVLLQSADPSVLTAQRCARCNTRATQQFAEGEYKFDKRRIKVFTQMTRRQLFDAMPGTDWTFFFYALHWVSCQI